MLSASCRPVPASCVLTPLLLLLLQLCCVWLAVVPPGYFLPQGANMQQCGATTFRESWVMHSDPKAATCTPCGDGIDSEPRDLDENPKAENGTLVRATSASCCEFPTLLLLLLHRTDTLRAAAASHAGCQHASMSLEPRADTA